MPSLFYECTRLKRTNATAAMKEGLKIEDAVLKHYHSTLGSGASQLHTARPAVVVHRDMRWLQVSPDAIMVDENGTVVSVIEVVHLYIYIYLFHCRYRRKKYSVSCITNYR